MRPLILMPTINSRHWNACYLQLLSVQRCQHPPQAERSCWGEPGGSGPPQQLGGQPKAWQAENRQNWLAKLGYWC